METNWTEVMWLQWFALGLFGVFVFLTLYLLLLLLPGPKKRWRWYRFRNAESSRMRKKLRQWVGRSSPNAREELQQLLRACGSTFRAEDYLVLKRATGMLLLVAFAGLLAADWLAGAAVSAALLVAISGDRILLGSVKKYRARRIVREVYTLSNQILYYSGSRMNLHGKLSRCLPHSRVLRKEMQWLLNEWYEDAGEALNRFKHRIGTDEGYSFAETLDALRLHDSEPYYDLLRQRIRDYKEKMELHRESRKETTSYVLFVMAGIPILNTFRVFLYPWVAEGRRLFEMLN